jgi:hypothetical protein
MLAAPVQSQNAKREDNEVLDDESARVSPHAPDCLHAMLHRDDGDEHRNNDQADRTPQCLPNVPHPVP